MAIGQDTFNTDALDSGAFSLDDNIATTAGYATLAAGGLLATAVGTMVALTTLGSRPRVVALLFTKYKESSSTSASGVLLSSGTPWP